MINYIDRIADALVEVLKYSNSEIEWSEASDLKPNDSVILNGFYPAILVEMKYFSAIRDAIIALGGKLPKPYNSKM